MPRIDDHLRGYLQKGIESLLSGKTLTARSYFEKVLAQIEVLDSGEAARVRDLQQVINLFDKANREVAKARDVAEEASREAEARWGLQEADQREVASRAAKTARASAGATETAVEEMRPRTIAAVSAATRHDRELLIADCQRSYRKAAAARHAAESAYREVKSARQRAHELEGRRKIAILVIQSFNKGVEAFRRKKYNTAIKCLARIVDPRARVDAGLKARARSFLKVVILTRKANAAAAEVQAVADNAIHDASGPWDPEDGKHPEAAERAIEAARASARAADRAAEQTREKAGAVVERRVYPGFPMPFWGLSGFFVGELTGKALWKLVENAQRFPRRGGRVLRPRRRQLPQGARPCATRWLPGRGPRVISNWTAAPVGNYVHVETADLYRPNARFTTETQGYQVLTPFGKLGYSQKEQGPSTICV